MSDKTLGRLWLASFAMGLLAQILLFAAMAMGAFYWDQTGVLLLFLAFVPGGLCLLLQSVIREELDEREAKEERVEMWKRGEL